MVVIKNGSVIDGVCQKIEIEVVRSDETSETLSFMWADLDTQFIKDITNFLIRKYS